jgi:hypothetical protein
LDKPKAVIQRLFHIGAKRRKIQKRERTIIRLWIPDQVRNDKGVLWLVNLALASGVRKGGGKLCGVGVLWSFSPRLKPEVIPFLSCSCREDKPKTVLVHGKAKPTKVRAIWKWNYC